MQQDDTVSFASAQKAACWGGMLQDGAACAARAAPLCCKTPFLPHVMEATMGKNLQLYLSVSPFAIPVRSCTVSGKRSSRGVPRQLIPRGI